MPTYRVKLTPLEYYFFGGERNDDYGNNRGKQKNSYFITSENLPTQTTLLGIIRFLALKKEGLLYDSQGFCEKKLKKQVLQQKQSQLIGKRSFQMDAAEKVTYGKINRIGTLFLMDAAGDYYIPTPFNHKVTETKGRAQYTPLKMMTGILTELGESSVLPSDLDVKAGCMAESFLKLTPERLIYESSELFVTQVRTGVDIQRNQQSGENEAFFKKQYKKFNPDYQMSFAFFVDLASDGLLSEQVIYCGKDKSAFLLTYEKQEDDLKSRVVTTLKRAQANHTYYYALSDIRFTPNRALPRGYYSMVKKRAFRNLRTNLKQKDHYHRLTLSQKYELIRAGSVFFMPDSESEAQFESCYQSAYENCERIGLNQMIKVEGTCHEC